MLLPDFTVPPKRELLTPQQFHDYQRAAEVHCVTHESAMLWLGMGLGKTVITLSAICDRMRAGQVQKTLIFGPLRVIQSVWEQEARKWSHTQHLTFSVVHGKNATDRARKLFAPADIYLCNYENMIWLTEMLMRYYLSQGKPLPFQMAVYDEVSKLKDSNTKRMKQTSKRVVKDRQGNEQEITQHGWRNILDHFQYRVGLTGTPAPNGYLDLHGQYLAVDCGERLGRYVTPFKDEYFASGFDGYSYSPTEYGRTQIESLISDITIKMDTRDYLDLPDVIETDLMVELPPKARKAYRDLEQEMFTELDSGAEIELFSKSSLSNKLLQLCNGQPYVNQDDHSQGFDTLHDAKLDALESVLEEAAGSPVLCSYTYRADAERIMKKFKKIKPVNLTETPASQTPAVLEKWKRGEIKLLIGHPASMGHGIDGLQESGSIIVWFGINWSLELTEQMNARINRQGQENIVKIIRILCNNSIDLAVADAIARKDADQTGLKAALQRYRDKVEG